MSNPSPARATNDHIEDGADLALTTSNAGLPADPAWWLNLQAPPHLLDPHAA
ncbi:hypothetical protein [Actinoplanes couchii]|uniref:hypothetical protein n=1 Tax=Actinoplanes couchii TaxID=403638 RepID=UPI0019415E94|nr:hypothetical protein [Actinoplanes couchii]MDR6318755.1 hypothetical protein [Actinoplanes couchii]